ncbi:hypothetical protein ACI78V_05475 [Geodermatophilus sp. SYSU D00742]
MSTDRRTGTQTALALGAVLALLAPVLTRALAVLGLLALPLTGVAGIAIGLGAAVEMVVALLLFVEVAVGAVAFAVVSRRSWQGLRCPRTWRRPARRVRRRSRFSTACAPAAGCGGGRCRRSPTTSV